MEVFHNGQESCVVEGSTCIAAFHARYEYVMGCVFCIFQGCYSRLYICGRQALLIVVQYVVSFFVVGEQGDEGVGVEFVYCVMVDIWVYNLLL